jgi:hypothetical protein
MMKNPDHRYKDWTETIAPIRRVLAGGVIVPKSGPEFVSTVKPPTITSKDQKSTQAVAVDFGIPLWIRVPAWTLLIIWWTLLAYIMLEMQAR